LVGDYHIATGAGDAYNNGNNLGAPNHDYDAQTRQLTSSNPADIGADEFSGAAAPPAPAGVALAALSPTTFAPSAARGVGLLGPVQAFTLSNPGTAPLTRITQATLGGASAGNFAIVRLLSTCGPAGGGQLIGKTTLNPGESCVVTGQFRPTNPAGTKNATLTLGTALGNRAAILTGTAR
jgi:hypothetical protein